MVHALEHVVAARSCPACSTWPATACWRCPRWPACWASPTRRCCRPGARAWRRASPAGWACASRRRCSTSCASAAGWTTAGSRPPGFEYGHTSREAVIELGEHLRLHPAAARRRRALPLRARGGGVPALEPHVRREAGRYRPSPQTPVASPRNRAEPSPSPPVPPPAPRLSRPRSRRPLRRPRGRGDRVPARVAGAPDLVALREYERATAAREPRDSAPSTRCSPAHPSRPRSARKNSQPRLQRS